MENDIESAKWDKIQDVILAPLKALIKSEYLFGCRLTVLDVDHPASLRDFHPIDTPSIYHKGNMYGKQIEFKRSTLIAWYPMHKTLEFPEYMSYASDFDFLKEVSKVIQGGNSTKIEYKYYRFLYKFEDGKLKSIYKEMVPSLSEL